MVAAPAGAALWLLANFGILPVLADFLNPVGLLLGMNGVVLLGFFLSLPANELLIPVILMMLSGAEGIQFASGQLNLPWQMAVCMMIFTIFHWPCSTTLLTVYRETGSMKKTAAAFALPTAVGLLLCLILNGIFYYLGA